MKRVPELFTTALIVWLVLTISCDEEQAPVAPSPAVDHTPPAVTWLKPAPDAQLAGEVELIFTVVDSSAVNLIVVYRNGYNPPDWTFTPEPSDTLHTIIWNTRETPDGLYILEIRAVDSEGNLGISPSLVVKVRNDEEPPPDDRTPPQLLWLGPDPAETVTDSALLEFRAWDENGVQDVILIKDGYRAIRMGVQPSGNYEYRWDARSEPAGVHAWEARAIDEAGNEGRSPVLALRVSRTEPPEDRIPPDLWWESPEGGATLKDTVVLRLRWFDESGVDSVQLLKDGEAQIVIPAEAGIQSGEVDYLWNTPSDSDGVHIWEARGWDGAGNEGRSSVLLVLVQNHEPPREDRNPPVITWVSPQPGEELQGLVEIACDVLDDSGVDSVKFYLSGATPGIFGLPGQAGVRYTVNWQTRDYQDGQYLLEARAWDGSGNVGFSEPLSVTVWNLRPRVIWVPDDFETIQGAINASRDGDTVRIRAGTYREGLRLMGKEIWLESEDGPEVTTIDGTGWDEGITFSDNEDSNTVIRGFKITCDWMGMRFGEDCGPMVYNCLVIGHESIGININLSRSRVLNCIIIGGEIGLRAWISWGAVYNTIFINCGRALVNYAVSRTAFEYGYNLFWNNVQNYDDFDPNPNDVYGNPSFIVGSFVPTEDSPAIDAGNPFIQDRDSTRSDIGLYGGPYSYPPDNH